MYPKELARGYDEIAPWWMKQMEGSAYGVEYVRKAMSLAKQHARVLDIGCGGTGRFIEEALKNKFSVTGIDVSAEMIRIARDRFPKIDFINEDFNEWNPSESFDLVVAWDSVFHAPQRLQEAITRKMCNLLTTGGILLFTAGGRNGEISGEMNGIMFDYGSLDYSGYLRIIDQSGCKIILMERDQYPEDHIVFICQKGR
jgi:2-polyprenyl-3-methyl-5-hydroxy-6-metoxy-1,4-benzoquinol methylase